MIKKFNEYTNESLLNKIKGLSKEEVSDNLGIEVKFDTAEDFFNDIIDNMEISEKTKKDGSIIWSINGIDIMKYDINSMNLWVDLILIWEPMKKIYGLTTTQMNVTIRDIFRNRTGFKNYPNMHQGTY